MEEQRVDAPGLNEVNYAKTDWVIFLVSLVVMIGLLFYVSAFFWIALPFTLTFLVKALKMM